MYGFCNIIVSTEVGTFKISYRCFTKINYLHRRIFTLCKMQLANIISDYYWRPYHGVVPHDALPGGRDAAGNVTYIGQVLLGFRNGVIPATITPGEKSAVAPYYGRYENDKFVQVYHADISLSLRSEVMETHALVSCVFCSCRLFLQSLSTNVRYCTLTKFILKYNNFNVRLFPFRFVHETLVKPF